MNNNTVTRLGTDKIREVLGDAKPRVIYQDDKSRIMLAENSEGVVGGYSFVRFHDLGKQFMPEIHADILKGKFMGEAYREKGVPVAREEETVFVYRLPPSLEEIFGKVGKNSFCKRLRFCIGHVRVPYATITEIYSPLASFDDLFEDEEGKAKEVAKEIDKSFNAAGNYLITQLHPDRLEEYLRLAHGFLKKPMHVGIQDEDEFVKQTLGTGVELLTDPNTTLLVAQNQQGLIGYLAANIHPALHVNGKECMLREMYVIEEGRRKGVASSLVNTMERLAGERGVKRISLATKMDDEVHSALYSGLGYQRRCDFVVKYLGGKNGI